MDRIDKCYAMKQVCPDKNTRKSQGRKKKCDAMVLGKGLPVGMKRVSGTRVISNEMGEKILLGLLVMMMREAGRRVFKGGP